MTIETGGVLGDRYRLGTVLGRGGMGVVFAAEDITGEPDEPECAIKVLDLSASAPEHREALRRRFKTEVRILRQLRGPNIIRVIRADEEPDGTLWIAMDLVNGPNLDQYVKSHGAFASADAFEIAAQLARALQAAHDKGIIHRDVKPSNVLLERPPPHPHVYLGDFGIAKILGDTPAQSTDVRFTPGYEAPEQFARGTVSRATDVYGLGRTLYVLLTARVPNPQEPLDLDNVRPDAADLLRRATAHAPADRPSLEAFEEELHELAAGARSRKGPQTPPPSALDLDGEPWHDPARTGTADADGTTDPPVPLTRQGNGTPDVDTPSRWRRGRNVVVGLAVFALVAVAVVLLLNREHRGPTPSEIARVQVVVDLSEKMFCPQVLEFGETCTTGFIKALAENEAELDEADRRPTRIGQALTFAIDGIEALDQPKDELGISTFYSSAKKRKFGTTIPLAKVRDVAPDPSEARAKIRSAFASITGTGSGGSPLRDAIDIGVDELRKAPPSAGSVTNTLVVLTDGNDNGSLVSADALRQRLSGLDPSRPVRVLVTAADEEACLPLLPIVDATDGDCFAAPDKASLTCAKTRIIAELRRPHPEQPRSRNDIINDRASCE